MSKSIDWWGVACGLCMILCFPLGFFFGYWVNVTVGNIVLIGLYLGAIYTAGHPWRRKRGKHL